MDKSRKNKKILKDSYFAGYEYKGYKVKTKLVIEGRKEYRPLTMSSSKEVYDNFRKLSDSDKERFYSVLLDAKNKVIGVEMVSQGSVDSSPVHPMEAYKSAFLSSAASVIFMHSHPSGNPHPPLSDTEITKQLKKVGDLMGIRVQNHVIIGSDSYYSFSDRGDLDLVTGDANGKDKVEA